VVVEIEGVVHEAPVPTWVPANCALYQTTVVHPEAVRVTVPVLHREAPVVVGAAGPDPVTVSIAVLL
jgi:hypothetical protein